MNTWHEFLATQKLSPVQTTNTLCALNESGLLYVGGDDAHDFLQNQLSNDINQISSTQAQLSSFSNAKGRMLAIFRVIQIEGGYLLMMPRSILPQVMQLLQKYIIRSQVVLADISDSFAMMSFNTTQDALTEDQRFPAQLHQVYQSDSLISLRIHSEQNQQRYLLLTNDANEAIDLWTQLAEHCPPSQGDSWRLQEIAAGIPTLYPQTMQAFVLQMSNLQLLDGVSFKKGCYPGQEVVARMQYLGKLKRRMYLAQIKCATCPDPGDELKSRDSAKNDGSGKVVDAVAVDDTHCLMLFIAQIDKAESGSLVLSEQPDIAINLLRLPYAEME